MIWALLLAATLTAGAQSKPNIIYILADDLGYGDLGCYGQQIVKTPNIDRMAKEGMRFTDHYSGSTVCAPSRCSLMTGKHTGNTTIKGNGAIRCSSVPMGMMGAGGQHPIKKDEATIASLLKTQGYRTGLIGKWGRGSPGEMEGV